MERRDSRRLDLVGISLNEKVSGRAGSELWLVLDLVGGPLHVKGKAGIGIPKTPKKRENSKWVTPVDFYLRS